MNPPLFIGVDVGATNTKIGLVDSSGQILEYHAFPSNLKTADPAPFLAAAYREVEPLIHHNPVKGIGLALCSLINEDRSGALLSVNAPALNDLDIKAAFETRFGVPAQVINDVNAYALAEAHFGAGKGTKRLLCLGLGTGLAIACIIEGRLVETWGGLSADAGRIILEPDADVRCNANVRGSAEGLCGTAHIERLARTGYGKDDISARDVIAACHRGGDPIAVKIMAEIGAHLGHLLALLCPVFFPQKILITGGTAEAGEPFFRAIRERCGSLIGSYMAGLAALEAGEPRPVEIGKAALGPEAAVIGAVLPFFINSAFSASQR